MKQNTLINDEIRCKSKLCASATECMPKMQCDKIDDDDSKVDNAGIKPKRACL